MFIALPEEMNLIRKTRLSMSLSGSERQINVSNLRLKSYSCVNFTNSLRCHQELIAFAPWQTRERRERVCRRRSWLKAGMKMQAPLPLRNVQSFLKRNCSQLVVLGMCGAGALLYLTQSNSILIEQMAQAASQCHDATTFDRWLACLTMSNVGQIIVCGCLCFLTAKYVDHRITATEDMVAVMHSRQNSLRCFSESVLDELCWSGSLGEVHPDDLEEMREWFGRELDTQDTILKQVSAPGQHPEERMEQLMYDLGGLPSKPTDAPTKGVGHGMNERVPQGSQNASPYYLKSHVLRKNVPRHKKYGHLKHRSNKDDGKVQSKQLAQDRASLERLLAPSLDIKAQNRNHHQLYKNHLEQMRQQLKNLVQMPRIGNSGKDEM